MMRQQCVSNVWHKPWVFRHRRASSLTILLCCTVAVSVSAQSSRIELISRRGSATRAVLDSLALQAQTSADADSLDQNRRQVLQRYAAELRTRLRAGDFQPGDRILLTLRIDSIITDTLTVQPDRSVIVRKQPPISLVGVLRSELQSYLTVQLHRYIKGDVLVAMPFLRLGILGEVAHPGFYRVPFALSLGDVLMVAGGPSAQADLTKLTVRRSQATVLDTRSAREAMVSGAPLSELNIDAGDEIIVQAKRSVNWSLITQIAGVATGALLALHAFKAF